MTLKSVRSEVPINKEAGISSVYSDEIPASGIINLE